MKQDHFPYVYKLVHRETGQFYHGVRLVNKVPPAEDLFVKYFSSSRTVKKLGAENFDAVVLSEFSLPDDAIAEEQRLIEENWRDPLALNKARLGSIASKKIIFNNIGRTQTEEHRRNIGLANIGKHFNNRASDPEVRMKNSVANTGKTHTAESKKKISDGLKGHVVSAEQRARKVAAQRLKNGGHYFSAEARKRLSESRKKVKS